MITPEQIQKTLEEGIDQAEVLVADLTGTGDHYQVLVISPAFEGKTLIDQHQMVYAPLREHIGGAIHALAIKTMTPKQWQESNSRKA